MNLSRPNPMEFYPTPDPFTDFLFRWMGEIYEHPIEGNVFEPCAGDGAIIRASASESKLRGAQRWRTNDLDPHWTTDTTLDACGPRCWTEAGEIDWTVSNPPFQPAVEIINLALKHSRVGVAMHLRASIHEVLKTGLRRSWLHDNTPTGILWLPRFAYQRSPTTGKWTTDSVTACWVVWLKERRRGRQFIDYAPPSTLDELDAFTPEYRKRMDAVMLDYQKLATEVP